MYYLGVYIRPFIFKVFLRAGDALGPLCSIWDATKHLVLMGGRKSPGAAFATPPQ